MRFKVRLVLVVAALSLAVLPSRTVVRGAAGLSTAGGKVFHVVRDRES